MGKSIKSELNRYLKELSRDELEKEILKLYSKFQILKKYYELELSQDTSKVLDEFKNRINKEYFTNRGGYGRASNKESRKVITEFKKISIFKKDVIELLLYRVKTMISYADKYVYVNDAFWNSLTSSYNEACKMVKEEQLEKEYQEECKKFIGETTKFWWDVSYTLNHIYNRYFLDPEDKY